MNMATEHFTVTNNLVFQPFKESKVKFEFKRELNDNVISGNYAIFIGVTIFFFFISFFIMG